MLKGHLQIDLHNEITGENHRIERDNMVTNALGFLLGLAANVGGRDTNHFNNLLPAATNALGGLFLFDGTLTEDVNNVHFPVDVHLTGHAGQEADTTTKLGGSLNVAESGRTDTGYVNVWDFSTSQANGTIASLALTHKQGGKNPFRGAQYEEGSISLDTSYAPVGYDAASGTIYLYLSGKVYAKKIYSNIIRAYTPYLGEETQVFDFAFSDPSSSYWTVTNGYDGYLYAVCIPSTSSKGTVTIRIRKVKISDGSFDEEPEQTFSISNITASPSSSIDYRGNTYTAVSMGYLYFTSYDDKILYKVNLSNAVDVSEISFNDVKCQSIYPMRGGGVFARFYWTGTTSSGSSTTYGSPGVIYPDNQYRFHSESISSNSDMNSYMTYEGDNLIRCAEWNNNYYYSFACNYLGTICNLASPVVKTSAQTMKITYTLTDAG